MAAPTLTAPSLITAQSRAEPRLRSGPALSTGDRHDRGNACTSVTVSSETALTCKSAAHAAGLVDIVLTNQIPSRNPCLSVLFGLPPTVTAVSPSAGALAGGGTALTGSNFITGATVSVGGISCTSPAIISTTNMTR